MWFGDKNSIILDCYHVDINIDSIRYHLCQMSQLAKRLGVSNHVVQKQKQYGRENFAAWSKQRDPDGIAWSWQGKLWKGKPMRFVPASSNKT